MKHTELFTSPARTLELINLQANAPENITFAKKYFPKFTDPNKIWDTIKPLVTFAKDPQITDTIQGISTLFNPKLNIHKKKGYGDCDCFVSALASIAIANKLPFEYIIQGQKKPSHIAIKISGTILDLTNPIPDYLRPYNFTKYIKPMFVSLADDNEELATETNDFGRPSLRRAINTAKRYAPKPAVRLVDRNLNRLNRIANRGVSALPPAARAKIMLTKRRLKNLGYSDSESEFLAIQNFSDDFGRGRISLKRGLQNVKKAGAAVGRAALKAAPILLPVAGGALNLIAPGVGGKVAGIASKALQRVGGAKTLQGIQAARNLIKQNRQAFTRLAPQVMQAEAPMLPMQTAPATLPMMQEIQNTPMQIEPVFSPDTFVTQAVPITAPKINPMLLIGAGAIALLLLTRKK